MHVSETVAPENGQAPSRRDKALAILRIGLGSGQTFGAVMTLGLLFETGLTLATQVAFTITTVLLCTSLLMKYLGCWGPKRTV
jgi:hypothetical protein